MGTFLCAVVGFFSVVEDVSGKICNFALETVKKTNQMEMNIEKVGSYEFLAEPFHCDFSRHLMMGHLGNYLLNAADFHAAARGFGMLYLSGIKRSWVLSRLAIEMDETPCAYDRFMIETWVESAMRYFTSRNFAVVNGDGKSIGFGRSVWAMIDTETRQPVNILEVNEGSLLNYVEKEKACPIDRSSRVNISEGAKFCREIVTGYSDIDVNGHVNSIKYIEHVLNLFPLSFYDTHRLRRFEIAYVMETRCGELLRFYSEETESGNYCVRVCKRQLEGIEEMEVCRCQLSFQEVRS